MREFQVVNARELAVAYAAADYTVEHNASGAGGVTDEHHLRVGEPAPALEAEFPASCYAFLTAWNPASQPLPDDANIAANAKLVARIDGLGIRRTPARAQSTDGLWREPGWLLLDAGPDQALALGREFGQAGILAWARGEAVALHMLAPRPEATPAAGLPGNTRWVRPPANA